MGEKILPLSFFLWERGYFCVEEYDQNYESVGSGQMRYILAQLEPFPGFLPHLLKATIVESFLRLKGTQTSPQNLFPLASLYGGSPFLIHGIFACISEAWFGVPAQHHLAALIPNLEKVQLFNFDGVVLLGRVNGAELRVVGKSGMVWHSHLEKGIELFFDNRLFHKHVQKRAYSH